MKRNKLYLFFAVIAYLLPLVIALTRIYLGSIPFWYDPARDLLLALSNHQKISLIGQTSGIPGIFYGPYWIWFLSIAEFISKDPRIIAFIILTLPYFIIFPLILFKFEKELGKGVAVILWLLFMNVFLDYATQIWNPHVAPFLILILLFLLSRTDYAKKRWMDFQISFWTGIIAGLLFNSHISIGLATLVGCYIFFIIYKRQMKAILLFTVGWILTFAPFFFFELRHGFNQIKMVIHTLLSPSAVVKEASQTDKVHIITQFLGRFSAILHVPDAVGFIILPVLVILVFIKIRSKKIKFSEFEKKLLLLIASVSFALLSIYLLSKNPVWDYHFIGSEVLFLLLIGVFINKIKYLPQLFAIWVIIISLLQLNSFTKELSINPDTLPSLATKEKMMNTIYDDSKNKDFSVFTYSPTTFTPDFDYLLKYEGEKRNALNRLTSKDKAKSVYVIIPPTSKGMMLDFLDKNTPNKLYKTTKHWHFAEGTTIFKREKNENI